MIAIDTNILVYVHRQDSEWHGAAVQRFRELAESNAAWALPWPCIREFYAVVTHPRIYGPPSTIEETLSQVRAWLRSPSVHLLSEQPGFVDAWERLLAESRATGPRVHDAHIAALCLHHGVRELWTADRDLSRFPGLRTRNPLVEG